MFAKTIILLFCWITCSYSVVKADIRSNVNLPIIRHTEFEINVLDNTIYTLSRVYGGKKRGVYLQLINSDSGILKKSIFIDFFENISPGVLGYHDLAFNSNTQTLYIRKRKELLVKNAQLKSLKHFKRFKRLIDIKINQQKNKIYVSDAKLNTVFVIDGSTYSISRIATLEKPAQMAIDELNNKLYVRHLGQKTITVIDTDLDQVEKTIDLSSIDLSDIWQIVVDSINNKLLIRDTGTQIITYSLEDDQIIGSNFFHYSCLYENTFLSNPETGHVYFIGDDGLVSLNFSSEAEFLGTTVIFSEATNGCSTFKIDTENNLFYVIHNGPDDGNGHLLLTTLDIP